MRVSHGRFRNETVVSPEGGILVEARMPPCGLRIQSGFTFPSLTHMGYGNGAPSALSCLARSHIGIPFTMHSRNHLYAASRQRQPPTAPATTIPQAKSGLAGTLAVSGSYAANLSFTVLAISAIFSRLRKNAAVAPAARIPKPIQRRFRFRVNCQLRLWARLSKSPWAP
jgi:hypothetical protein